LEWFIGDPGVCYTSNNYSHLKTFLGAPKWTNSLYPSWVYRHEQGFRILKESIRAVSIFNNPSLSCESLRIFTSMIKNTRSSMSMQKKAKVQRSAQSCRSRRGLVRSKWHRFFSRTTAQEKKRKVAVNAFAQPTP
jgi:hypothetical protein